MDNTNIAKESLNHSCFNKSCPQEAKLQATTVPVFSFKFSLLLCLEIYINSQNLPKPLETLPSQLFL